MSNRRLAPDSVQPASFEFTPENKAWVATQIAKYPEGRQASAVIPMLWQAQKQANGWLPVPRRTLPFRSMVAASTNDPLGSLDRVTQLASNWGSELVNVGALGHINPASGFGEWPLAEQLIQALES